MNRKSPLEPTCSSDCDPHQETAEEDWLKHEVYRPSRYTFHETIDCRCGWVECCGPKAGVPVKAP
jgi:hypothetical protein